MENGSDESDEITYNVYENIEEDGSEIVSTLYSDADAALLIGMLQNNTKIRYLRIEFQYDAPRAPAALLSAIAGAENLDTVSIMYTRFYYRSEESGLIPVSRRQHLQLGFRECKFDSEFIHAMFGTYVASMQLHTLGFENCRVRPLDTDVVYSPVRWNLRTLALHFDGSVLRPMFQLLDHISIRKLWIKTNSPPSEWLGSVNRTDLHALSVIMPGNAETNVDDGIAIPAFINASHALRNLCLDGFIRGLAPETISTIGRRQFRFLNLRACRIDNDTLRACVLPQRNLSKLYLPCNVLRCASVPTLVEIISNNRVLEILNISDSCIPKDCAAIVARELFKSPYITEFYAKQPVNAEFQSYIYYDKALNRHMESNLLKWLVDGDAAAPIRMVPAFVTGPLREKALAILGALSAFTPAGYERRVLASVRAAAHEVANARIAASEVEGRTLPKDPRPDWWGAHPRNAESFAELHKMIESAAEEGAQSVPAAPGPATMCVSYAIERFPASGDWSKFIHVRTVAHGHLDAAIDADRAQVRALLIVSEDAPTDAQKERLKARGLPGVARAVSFSDLASAIAQFPDTGRLVDRLWALEAVRSPAMYLSPPVIALMSSDYGPDIRVNSDACIWALRDGGAIARLPTLLEDLRDIFATRVLLVRALGRRPGPANWYEDGCIFPEAAAAVFNYALGTGSVSADESIDLMTAFGVIFPVDQRRVVFPKFRRVPAVAYRVYAWVAGKPGVRAPRMDETSGVVRFYVQAGYANVQMEIYPSATRTVVAQVGGSRAGDYMITSANIAGTIEQGIREHLKKWAY